MIPRVGIGYDVHRFAAGRALVLGGVTIAHGQGLVGHSDADALAHAVADALLGALALGDLGAHFPDSDARWAEVYSLDLLRHVVGLVRAEGYAVGNVDATVLTEEPRLAPHVPAMRQALAGALGVDERQVSVKATRPEGLGGLAQGQGLAVWAVGLVVPREERGSK